MIPYPGNEQYFGYKNKYTASAGARSSAFKNSSCMDTVHSHPRFSADMKCVNNPYSNLTDTSAQRYSPSATTLALLNGLGS